jgi:TPR repeat protein
MLFSRLGTSCQRRLRCSQALAAVFFLVLGGKAALADTAAGLAYMKRGAYFRAMVEFQDPAKAGDPIAQSNLGAIYYYGLGVPADFTQSAYWYHAAAMKGNIDAQLGLAILYTTGQGVPPNFSIAHMWLTIAENAMPPSPDRARVAADMKALASKMSPGEIAQSKSLLEAWYNRHTAP